MGIDDYVVKPFSPKELLARLNVIISRNCAYAKTDVRTDIYESDGLKIDFLARNVYVDEKKVDLTPKEYDLLFFLVRNKNFALSREKILNAVWGYDFYGDDRTVDTHIKMLRGNLGKYRDYIITLRGIGYKFEG